MKSQYSDKNLFSMIKKDLPFAECWNVVCNRVLRNSARFMTTHAVPWYHVQTFVIDVLDFETKLAILQILHTRHMTRLSM